MALRFLVAIIMLLMCAGAVQGQEQLKPYVLSSHVKGDFEKTVIEVEEALIGAGFRLVGGYSPYEDAHVIVATDNRLRALLNPGDIGTAFIQGLRIAVTRSNGQVQVAYADPVYFGHAYRLKSSLSDVREQLVSVLGEQARFGSAGMTPSQLRGYHYSYGLEYFSDFLQLGKYRNHRQAVKALERGLSENRGGIYEIYRIEAPEKGITLFGVALTEGAGSDDSIMERLDTEPLKRTARLPYEIVVHDGRVLALHPRFRIAIDFPDMRRVGDHGLVRFREAMNGMEIHLKALLDSGVKR
ncbi:MAG: hypothetical protein ABW079_01315 [Sedimenticola sp.]